LSVIEEQHQDPVIEEQHQDPVIEEQHQDPMTIFLYALKAPESRR
jgi:hypothetical protein